MYITPVCIIDINLFCITLYKNAECSDYNLVTKATTNVLFTYTYPFSVINPASSFLRKLIKNNKNAQNYFD